MHQFIVDELNLSDTRLDELAVQIKRATRDPRILVHLLRQLDPEGFQYTDDYINCLIVALEWPTDTIKAKDYEVRLDDNQQLVVVSLLDQSVLSSKSNIPFCIR